MKKIFSVKQMDLVFERHEIYKEMLRRFDELPDALCFLLCNTVPDHDINVVKGKAIELMSHNPHPGLLNGLWWSWNEEGIAKRREVLCEIIEQTKPKGT